MDTAKDYAKLISVSLLLFCFILNGSFSSVAYGEEKGSQDSEEEHVLDPVVQHPPIGKIPSALVHLSEKTTHALVVDKELRTLTLWKNSKVPSLVAAYPTDMGKNKGDKLFQGDHKTPEGIYFFQETYEQPYLDFSLYGKRAFTMNYPNFFDRIEKKTGGGIWLHAIPDTISLNRGSRGCVVVRNEVIEHLKGYIELRTTPIIVQNKVAYISPTEWSAQKSILTSWLDGWKKAWESKDIESYISHYDDNFKTLGMNLKQWKSFKENLNSKYSFIKVELEKVDIFKNRDQYIFRFSQNYESDQNQDFGEKYLYVEGEAGQLKILGEDWTPIKHSTTITASQAPQDKS